MRRAIRDGEAAVKDLLFAAVVMHAVDLNSFESGDSGALVITRLCGLRTVFDLPC